MNSQLSKSSNAQTESLKASNISADDKIEIRRRDAALVQRSQNGELEAFDELVTHYRGTVYAMIVNMIHNDADARDLAQDVFVKSWNALPKFEARSSFYTWLYRITHNVTYDWIRKKKVRGDSEFDDGVALDAEPGSRTVPKAAAAPDVNITNHELGTEIEAAIGTLSEEHRSVILLKEVDGLRYQEIADVMETSVGTVMSRLFYARKKLRTILNDLYAS